MTYDKACVFSRVIGGWLLYIVSAHNAHAGAWMQDGGKGQISNSTYASTASERYAADGGLSNDQDFFKFETIFYGEHGILDDWTFVYQASLQDTSQSGPDFDERYNGLGPTELHIKRKIWRGERAIISAQIGIIFSDRTDSASGAGLSDQGEAYEARLLAGHSLKIFDRYGFIDGQIAFRDKSGFVGDEWRLDISAGLDLTDEFQIIGQSFASKSDGNAFPLVDNKYIKSQASVNYRYKPGLTYHVGAFATVYGRDVFKERGIVAGVRYDY